MSCSAVFFPLLRAFRPQSARLERAQACGQELVGGHTTICAAIGLGFVCQKVVDAARGDVLQEPVRVRLDHARYALGDTRGRGWRCERHIALDPGRDDIGDGSWKLTAMLHLDVRLEPKAHPINRDELHVTGLEAGDGAIRLPGSLW